jgi:hypothetical protein
MRCAGAGFTDAEEVTSRSAADVGAIWWQISGVSAPGGGPSSLTRSDLIARLHLLARSWLDGAMPDSRPDEFWGGPDA